MSEYSFSINLAFCSSVLFLLSILTYVFLTDKTISFLLLLSSTGLIYICSAIFLSENHAYTQHYKSPLSWIVRISWVAGSFYAYALARHDFMNIADLAYDQTASRFFVILYAGLIVMAYISLAVTSAGLFFYKFEDTSLTDNKKEVRIIRESFPLFIPLSMTAIISILIFISNTKLIFNTALNISIPVDTTDTFKCNDTSMVLGSEGDHYYLLVDKGEYRVFTYKHDDWYVSALNCRKEKPYFILTDIKRKNEIISDNFSGIIKNARDNFDAMVAQ